MTTGKRGEMLRVCFLTSYKKKYFFLWGFWETIYLYIYRKERMCNNCGGYISYNQNGTIRERYCQKWCKE